MSTETTTDASTTPSFMTRMARAYRLLMEQRQDQADREIARRRAWHPE